MLILKMMGNMKYLSENWLKVWMLHSIETLYETIYVVKI